MPDYTIYFGSDHRGFAKKAELVKMIGECHPFLHTVDCGPLELDPDDDFNDAAIAVSSAVLEHQHSFGVLICGSAHGVTMQANRIKGIRAINAVTPASATIGREHDYANILCLPADELEIAQMEPIIKAFCHARENSAPRYARRVARLDDDKSWPSAPAPKADTAESTVTPSAQATPAAVPSAQAGPATAPSSVSAEPTVTSAPSSQPEAH